MKQLTVAAAALLVLSAGSTLLTTGCGKEEPVPPVPTSAGSGARPEKMPNGEPAVITVKHVLISFSGAGIDKVTRTREEAQKLAYEILNRAKSGEDFDKLMKDHSDDNPLGGTYAMTNHGMPADENAKEANRSGMVPAFGDVGFRIHVNEIALAEHDAKTSPYGWHIIKRIK